jgi:hypothetical protein
MSSAENHTLSTHLMRWLQSDDQDAESAMISTVASHSDDIEEHHITNTSCEVIDSTTRRLQPSLGTNTTVVYANVPIMERLRRRLGDWTPNKTVEIAVDLLAPAKTSGLLASLVVADLDTAIDSGIFLEMLLELSVALNITMFEYANVEDAYLIREEPEEKLGFLDPTVVAALASSATVGAVGATAASSAVPAGDPLSLVFAVQFVSLTSSIDGLPSAYSEDYAGTFGWYVAPPNAVQAF